MREKWRKKRMRRRQKKRRKMRGGWATVVFTNPCDQADIPKYWLNLLKYKYTSFYLKIFKSIVNMSPHLPFLLRSVIFFQHPYPFSHHVSPLSCPHQVLSLCIGKRSDVLCMILYERLVNKEKILRKLDI